MATVTSEELAAARDAAAAAVRIGPSGVSVRMPRLGSVRHGSIEAALRGCPCQLCDCTRDNLLLDEPDVDHVDQVAVDVVDHVERDQVEGGQVDHEVEGWPLAAMVAPTVPPSPAGPAGPAAEPLSEPELPAGPQPVVSRDVLVLDRIPSSTTAGERTAAAAQLVASAGAGGDDWRDRALCAQVDTELFFPEKGGSSADAKRVCLACEVRVECLQYALDNGERFGIWGGLSERERRRLDRQQQSEPVPAAAMVAVVSGVAS